MKTVFTKSAVFTGCLIAYTLVLVLMKACDQLNSWVSVFLPITSYLAALALVGWHLDRRERAVK